MARLRIKAAKGPMAHNVDVFLDDIEISKSCQLIDVHLEVAQTMTATFKVLLDEVDIDLADILVRASESEISKAIRDHILRQGMKSA